MEWVAFDAFEPIGTRTTPDLLALLIALTLNLYRKKGDRPVLPRDILDDPLLPRRLTPAEEAQRTAHIAAEYRRGWAERRAKMEAEQAKE